MHAALQSYKKNNHSMKLVARVVIYKRRLDEKIVHIIDHEYTIEQASRVSKLFYKEKNGKRELFENHNDYLIGTKN